jgi:RHS repeat-associated protein
MNNRRFRNYILFILILQAQLMLGGTEPAYSSILDGSYFIQYTNSPNYIANATFVNDLFDFNVSSSQYSFPANQHIRKIDNMLELYLDPNSLTFIDFAYSLEVEVNITKYELGASTPSSVVTTLKINYDPKERTKWVEKANFHFTNCGRVQYQINKVSLSATSTLTDLQKESVAKIVGLRSDIVIERYYDFDVNACLTGTAIWNTVNTASNELTIHWQVIPGAEYYDLEWAYVDHYNGAGGHLSGNQLILNKHFNLNRNSTRVQVAQTEYTFPVVYESGYLLYRVRGIGIEYDPALDQLYMMPGRWSNPVDNSPTGPDQAPNVGSWIHKYAIPVAFEHDNLNWQIITSYSEEGKSKSIIGIRDGTERNRQTITGLSTEHMAMVAEEIYDHQGRAAIHVLPVPTNDPTLKYYKNFNQPASNQPYNRLNFDIDRPVCDIYADPMDNSTSGASRYYSPKNPDKSNENAYIPDAVGYPFTQTEYTPDNTGRIRRQSGVGMYHKLGSGHETQYFYGTPSQEELSMMFGVEVGNADHYKKNVVQDPNGQLSVSYLDLKGKVIATALAGNPPENLDSLVSYHSHPMNIDLMVFNKKDSLANELEATKSFTVTTESDYNFSYTISNTAFKAALCDGIQLCYDCVYDLEVTVIDNYSCDTVLYHVIKQINPLKFNPDSSILVDDSCPKNPIAFMLDSTSSPKAFKIRLKVGSYTVTKKLKVNEAATNAYVNHYLTRFYKECKSVYDSILHSYLSHVDSAACDIKDTTPALNRCGVAREGMLADMSPGGQYGLIDWANYSALDPLSVFNTGNILPETRANNHAFWNNPNLVYKHEDGTPALIPDPSGQMVKPNASGISLQLFLENWEPSWAEALLPYHPEYCYLEWCENDNPSFDFDVDMAEINTYVEANKKGYISTSTPFSILNKDPYFSSGSGNTATLLPKMKGYISQYYVDANNNNQPYSMLEVAVLTELLKSSTSANLQDAKNWISSHTSNLTTEDMVWQNYRALYLSKKEQLQYGERTYFALNNCKNNNGGYNECIGADPFLWQKNGFNTGAIFGGQFFNTSQTCSWTTYHLYKDKAIRFPSVYNIPINFDPYGDPGDALAGMANWANGMISSNCDTCVCNIAVSQFINWVIAHKIYYQGNQLVSLPPASFTPVLQQKLKQCYNSTITQIKAQLNSNSQLVISLANSAGSFIGSFTIDISPGKNNSWETADSIGCISYVGKDSSKYVAGGSIFFANSPGQPVTLTIDRTCPLWENCSKPNPSCPPTEDGKNLSQLLNTLISKQELDKTVSVISYVSNSFATINNTTQDIEPTLTWIGQLTGNTLNASLSGSQVNCRFTMELPPGLILNTLGNVISFAPDNSQIDPVTGYTYQAIMQVGLLSSNGTVNIKVKSNCFPFSYCLKCPPGENTDPKPRPIKPSITHQKAKKKNKYNPDRITSKPATDNNAVSSLPKPDPKEPCNPCDPKNFTMDYDSVVNESKSVMVHSKPPSDLCDPCAWPKDTAIVIPIPNPCIEEQIIGAYANAWNEYQHYLDSLTKEIRNGYIRHCMNASETFSVRYMDALHHFTLYYYDQANNLLKTIPPDGVKLLNQTATIQAIKYMHSHSGIPVTPLHTMPSDYTYNSLNQLRKQTLPDHDGETVFFYDYLSRIVASQNPKQRKGNTHRYSYSLYDPLNRPYETGELTNVSTSMTDVLAKNEKQFLNWITNNKKSEITRTQYDKPLQGIAAQYFNGDESNYRSRVASVTYIEQGTNPVQNSTYYQYDIHGNVKKLVQDIHQLGPKTIAYDYDLISGNVKKVYYQKGELDQFLHWYEYDADNRITTVRTSFDGQVWDTDAEYYYYRHGPLARTELGENKVQAIDFAYTIQGWIKGVNSAVLNENVDIGQDGVSGHPHQWLGRDAFGYMLNYYTDDYRMIGNAPGGQGWEPGNQVNVNPTGNRDLYNGNIQSMITAIGEPVNGNIKIPPLGYAYTYDQLNRIRSMQAYDGLNQKHNTWLSPSALSGYATQYTYDGNGNLQHLSRNGSSNKPEMDDLTYHYKTGKNQLEYVSDVVPAGNYSEDIDDQSPGNYQYDAIGNLVMDNSENLSINWNVNGKVKSIQKNASNELLEFSYDPSGNRILKKLTNTLTNKAESTYYVPDATGNVIATYKETTLLKHKTVDWESAYVYGSSRLGEERIDTSLSALKTIQNLNNSAWYSYRNRGSKFFELGNHLGNVLATVGDRKLPLDNTNDHVVDAFSADITTVNDYYPFGMEMPGRSYNPEEYRYGFNGKEKDDEVKGTSGTSYDYGFRLYDPQLARYLSIDPLIKQYPWYSPFQISGNSPILNLEADGSEELNNNKTNDNKTKGENKISKVENNMIVPPSPLKYSELSVTQSTSLLNNKNSFSYIDDQKELNGKGGKTELLTNVINNHQIEVPDKPIELERSELKYLLSVSIPATSQTIPMNVLSNSQDINISRPFMGNSPVAANIRMLTSAREATTKARNVASAIQQARRNLESDKMDVTKHKTDKTKDSRKNKTHDN